MNSSRTTLSSALFQDGKYRFQIVEELENVLAQLKTFQATNPTVFAYLCDEGRLGNDFTPQDALVAIEEALENAREIELDRECF